MRRQVCFLRGGRGSVFFGRGIPSEGAGGLSSVVCLWGDRTSGWKEGLPPDMEEGSICLLSGSAFWG